MRSTDPLRRTDAPVATDDHARENLRFIRETMERAGSFTAVPGWGGVAIGITALGAAVIASRQTSSLAWLMTWLGEAAVAVCIAAWTTLTKAREAGSYLFSGPGGGFVSSVAPWVFVGGDGRLVRARMVSTVPAPGV